MSLDDYLGRFVRIECTVGWATPTPVTRIVEGTAKLDDEGCIRVAGVNITRDSDGYFPTGIVILSIQ